MILPEMKKNFQDGDDDLSESGYSQRFSPVNAVFNQYCKNTIAFPIRASPEVGEVFFQPFANSKVHNDHTVNHDGTIA